jgi:hypothetical protein
MIELMVGLRARATKDLDAVFRAQFDAWLEQLDDAISQPVGGSRSRERSRPAPSACS